MIKLGITGGIGSGKTTICKMFKELGIPVYEADAEAKRIMREDLLIRTTLVEAFKGDDILDDDGFIDRKKLAAIVFSNKSKLEILNGIIHPFVRSDFAVWTSHQTAPYVIMESAIMFESRTALIMDYVLTVTALKETRIQRAMKRDGSTREEVLARMDHQMPEESKVALSKFVVTNEGNNAKEQVLDIHEKIKYTSTFPDI